MSASLPRSSGRSRGDRARPAAALIALALSACGPGAAGPGVAPRGGEIVGGERGLELEAGPGTDRSAKTTPAFERARAVYAHRLALVVGINAYESPVPALRFAVDDARRTGALLRQIGFEQVETLEDAAATRSGILDALEKKLPSIAGSNDLVVVYFAGHGVTVKGQGYLLPKDSTRDVEATGLSVQRLKEAALRMKAAHVLFLADACFSGTMFHRGEPAADYNRQAFWDAVADNRVVQVISAGGDGETVLEQDGWGVFTRALHDGLGGSADENGDLVITVAELGTFLTREVPARSKEHQHPQWGWIDGTGMITLVDERRGPPEEGFSTKAHVPQALATALAPVLASIEGKEMKRAEEAVRDLLLKEDRVYYHLILAEIYLATDALGNASSIEAELRRAEAGGPDPTEMELLLTLRARLERARRRTY